MLLGIATFLFAILVYDVIINVITFQLFKGFATLTALLFFFCCRHSKLLKNKAG
jgi:hypothetical protein